MPCGAGRSQFRELIEQRFTIKWLTTSVASARLWLYCALPWPTLAASARFEPSLPCRFINITLDIGEWIAFSAIRLFTVFLRVIRNIGIFFFEDLVSQQESKRAVRGLMARGS